MEKKSIPRRLRGLDWEAAWRSLDELEWARLPGVLTAAECALLRSLYTDDRRFRSTVDMERHRFGRWQYRYFRYPLPPIVAALRAHSYPYLQPIANQWAERLGGEARFPPTLPGFLWECREKGQTKPTPLLLRYGREGYNCLHRDLYGEVAFPLQMTVFLSRPGRDYDGGAFLLVEQRPREQSRGEALLPQRGDAVVFATADRPLAGSRGFFRVSTRHGVSRITRGSRDTLGIIFHDAG